MPQRAKQHTRWGLLLEGFAAEDDTMPDTREEEMLVAASATADNADVTALV